MRDRYIIVFNRSWDRQKIIKWGKFPYFYIKSYFIRLPSLYSGLAERFTLSIVLILMDCFPLLPGNSIIIILYAVSNKGAFQSFIRSNESLQRLRPAFIE